MTFSEQPGGISYNTGMYQKVLILRKHMKSYCFNTLIYRILPIRLMTHDRWVETIFSGFLLVIMIFLLILCHSFSYSMFNTV